MLRAHISGRALRVHLAPLALGSLGALSLAAPSAGEATTAGGATATRQGGTAAGGLAPSAPSVPGGTAVDGLAPAASFAPGGTLAVRARARTAFQRLHSELNVLDGHAATVAGRLLPGHAGRLVELQRRGRHGRWHTLARSFTGKHGGFRIRYATHSLHSQLLRLLFPGDYAAASASRRVGRLSVFRLAGASWYGGGGSLACGGWLSSSTLGVANKTLPCGTLVTIRYGGRSITVPVIDRGPYVAGRDFDLTEATKRALGFEGTGEVWSSR